MKFINAKKCKCIKDYYNDILLYKSSDDLHDYSININHTIYIKYYDEYCVFSKNINDQNTEYFNEYFLDVKEERKLKLKKLKLVR